MQWFYKGFKINRLAAIFLLIIFTGCATKEAVKSVSDEEALRARVMVYWDSKIKGELDKTYQMEQPGYRKAVSLVNYILHQTNPTIVTKGFEIADMYKRDTDHAEVSIRASQIFKAPGSKPFEHDMVLTEQWVRINGEWYHVFGNKKLTQENNQ